MAKHIVVEVSKCMSCRACEIACAVAHSSSRDLMTVAREGERPGHRITVEGAAGRGVPIHCNHCETPACVFACPTGAMHRLEPGGPVLADDKKCIGCKMCVQACPFGVIALRQDGMGILKCDHCAERLAAGQDPACVMSCPTGALSFVEDEQSNRAKRRKTAAQLLAAQSGAQEGAGQET